MGRRTFNICNQKISLKNPSSQFYRGLLYMNGIGTKKNKKKALQLIRLAANRNYPSALYTLSSYYYHGIIMNNAKSKTIFLRKNIKNSIKFKEQAGY